jgi:hypothetical protein
MAVVESPCYFPPERFSRSAMTQFQALLLLTVGFGSLNTFADANDRVKCERIRDDGTFECTRGTERFTGPIHFGENRFKVAKATFQIALREDTGFAPEKIARSEDIFNFEVEFPQGPSMNSFSRRVYYGEKKEVSMAEAKKLAPQFFVSPLAQLDGTCLIPFPITEAEFSKRYVTLAKLKKTDADALAKVALPKLLALPADHIARPGNVFGGQFLSIVGFETDGEVLVGTDKGAPDSYGHGIRVIGGDAIPGDRDIALDSKLVRNDTLPVDKMRATEDFAYLFGHTERGWFSIAEGGYGDGRYRAQIKNEGISDQAEYVLEKTRFFEGTLERKDGQKQATFFILDVPSLSIRRVQPTFVF